MARLSNLPGGCYNLSVQISVRFFAVLKDRAGVAHASIELNGHATVAAAMRLIAERFPQAANDLKRAAAAVNREYVLGDAVLKDGDELALIPPVSGG
jgi:molybdopterin synthase catalytic subunit